ncbi:MAG TPA: hypothetical protein VNT30_09290 [Stellaceae bacterium]|nr:hypothetical protein [Stellaceae bacterium]
MRQRLPDRRLQITEAVEWNGRDWIVAVGFDRAGRALEVFIDGHKTGSAIEAWADDSCILLSRLLQHGETAAALLETLAPNHTTTGAGERSLMACALVTAVRVERESRQAILDAYAALDTRSPPSANAVRQTDGVRRPGAPMAEIQAQSLDGDACLLHLLNTTFGDWIRRVVAGAPAEAVADAPPAAFSP